MYMATTPNLDYWSTDNCCFKWSLRTGATTIALLSMVWQALWVAVMGVITVECEGELFVNCSLLPEPEREALDLFSNHTLAWDANVVTLSLSVFFSIYFILSLLVLIGIIKKLPRLMTGWVFLTMLMMILVLLDLAMTLAFTTVLHLLINVAHFIASLYTWAVVKSHMHELCMEKKKVPLPEGTITEYTVDGVDSKDVPVLV